MTRSIWFIAMKTFPFTNLLLDFIGGSDVYRVLKVGGRFWEVDGLDGTGGLEEVRGRGKLAGEYWRGNGGRVERRA